VAEDDRNAPRGKSRSTATILIVVAVLAFAVLPLLGLFTALGIYGFRRYIANAKLAEGRNAVAALAQGIARCSTPRGYVPKSSTPVPAELSSVSGRKYMSLPDEWSQEAFRCGSFAMTDPQYFQYHWLSDGEASGVARADADLDGDGHAEIRLETDVVCGPSGCQAAPNLRETVP
jgi:hypothetical protein